MTARVTYSMNVSLDGFINSPSGSLEWANVDEELHAWFNDRAREASAFIYGRRLYETMAAYWPTALDDPEPVIRDFAAIWNSKPKVVFSRTLTEVGPGTSLLDTDILGALPALKDQFDGELDVGGATLAGSLVARNLVDAYRIVVHPVLIGGGTPFFPALERQLDLVLTDSHRFTNGAVLLTYEPRR